MQADDLRRETPNESNRSRREIRFRPVAPACQPARQDGQKRLLQLANQRAGRRIYSEAEPKVMRGRNERLTSKS